MNDPLKTQVGGDHYKGMTIQPIELSLRNGYDAAIHSSMKYISRHAAKGGSEDILKALHFVELREDHLAAGNGRTYPFGIDKFIGANNIPMMEANILMLLHAYSRETSPIHSAPRAAYIIQLMRELRDARYGSL